MSDNEVEETALVLAKRKPFAMPNFKGRKDNLKAKWDTLIKTTNLDVKNHVDKEINRLHSKMNENIQEGAIAVVEDQKDLAPINAKIVAMDKKIELERKIKHMGIHQAVLRKGEMEEKLRLLNENAKYLASESLDELPEEAGEGDAEGSNDTHENKGKNRRSVDIIRKLEDQIGLPISTKNARIMNYKDKMHISKDELMKSQESAKLFVEKMKERQKEVERLRKANRERTK